MKDISVLHVQLHVTQSLCKLAVHSTVCGIDSTDLHSCTYCMPPSVNTGV